MKTKSGGIYVNTPTHFNTKCVIFGGVLATGYWFLPSKKNPFILPVIFTCAYIVMAWYDKLYNCEEQLYSGSSSWGAAILDSIFKPQRRDSDETYIKNGKYLVSDQEVIYRRYVYLFHLLVVVPLFVGVGYYSSSKFVKRLYTPLLGIAILGMLYHTYRTFRPRPEQSYVIYPTHLGVFLPLALYIGLYGKLSNMFAFNGLLGLGLMAGVYHSLKFFQL